MESKFGFAKYYLKSKGLELYAKGKRHLELKESEDVPFYFKDYPALDINFNVNSFELPDDLEIIKSYKRVQEQFKISLGKRKSENVVRAFGKTIRKKEYYLEWSENISNDHYISYFPKGSYFEHSPSEKKIKAIFVPRTSGKGNPLPCDTEWFVYGRVASKNEEPKKADAVVMKSLFGIDEKVEYVKKKIGLDLLPCGISIEERKVVCIPFEQDLPIIGLGGMTRGSKTWILHGLGDLLFHHLGVPWLSSNDPKFETITWSLPFQDSSHDKEYSKFNQLLNIPTRPLPIVYTMPSARIMPRGWGENEEVLMKISLSWKEFADNFGKYTRDFGSLDLGPSEEFLDKEALRELNNLDEARDMIRSMKQNKKTNPDGIPSGSVTKIINMLNKLERENLFDITSGYPSSFTLKKNRQEQTFEAIACLLNAGLCVSNYPKSLSTVHFGNKDFQPRYVALLVDRLFELKLDNKLLPNKTMYVLVDELNDLILAGVTRPIEKIASQGAGSNIGLIWATQHIGKVKEDIIKNTGYFFQCKTNDEEGLKRVCRMYECKPWFEDILGVGKGKLKQEAWILHTNPLVTIRLDNGFVETVPTRPIKVRLLTPMSHHKQRKDIPSQIKIKNKEFIG